ncbi:DUF5682 family protein [Novosphingobium sediminis]|uniref:DUF5682 family protein n=1 Tax=Novosphingobium sediminis TaxID=707214 RepID=UPI0011BDE299|nr:DUF5682 family protein [Novosphingobium sediminis]
MDAPPLRDSARDLWIVPIRHHSPACASQLERLLAEVAPAAILIEGPLDFEPLIEQVCDPRTRAPVAIVVLRDVEKGGGTRRVVSYFPFCNHSPELIALQTAKARGIQARFIDLPSTDAAMVSGDEDAGDRSLVGDETPFDVGDYVTALARELGCRDGNEVWDQLFEARIAEPDWARFFADVGQYCACIRGAVSAETMGRDGTLAREAQMRALIARHRAAIEGPIVVLVGGFHAAALIDPAHGKVVEPKAGAGAGRSYLVRYGMRQLDALAGYGAGLALPGFYERLWQARESGGASLALDLITGFAAHLRGTDMAAPSLPVVLNAVEQAERLAALRGRPFPARDDIVDAVRSSFIKDEIPLGDVPLLAELRTWLTGSAIGDVPPSAGSPPLVEAVREKARGLGFTVADGERRTRELDIYRKPRHREASRLCHALALIGSGFAQRTAGPDFRNDAGLDRLHEIWSVCWSPQVETRLIELSEVADTLMDALAAVLAEKLAGLAELGRGHSALAAIDLYAAACRAGLGEAAEAVLDAVERHVLDDPELASLVAALTDLVLLRRSRDMLDIADTVTLDRIMAATWRRILTLLPELAWSGEDQLRPAIAALADLRGLMELARSSAAPLDLGLFDEALARLGEAELDPMLAGAVTAFAITGGQIAPAALGQRLRGELASGYVDPADRLAFLGGVIAIARELLWTTPVIITALNDVVAGASEEDFVALLPHLRLALMPLDPRETDRLASEVADLIGADPNRLATLLEIPEADLAANLALDRELQAILALDGLA